MSRHRLWWTWLKLRSPLVEMRVRAVRDLEAVGNSRSLAQLAVAQRDTSPRVREAATRALGRVSGAQATELLIMALMDHDGCVEEAAAQALDAVDPRWARSEAAKKTVPVALAALSDSGGTLERAIGAEARQAVSWTEERPDGARGGYLVRRRAAAARLLGRIGDARAIAPLVAALADPAHEFCRDAAWALGQIGDARAVEPLAAALRDRHFAAEPAGDALVHIGGAQVLQLLVSALGDEREHVRAHACRLLARIGDARAAEPLVSALGDPQHLVREAAAEALDSLGWRPVNDGQRALRAISLARFEEAAGLGSAAILALIEALQDQQPDVQARTAEALGQIGDPRGAAPLNRAIQASTSLRVHLACSSALRRIPGGELVPTSQQVLVESFASEIRFLYARTRTVVDREYWNALGASGYAVERVTESHEEPDPDIEGIRELISLIPYQLLGRVRALSGEAARLFP